STRGLPEIFSHPLVTLRAGNIRDPATVDAAIDGIPVVVNLAHGGESGSRERVTAAMVGGAETVAQACLRHGVRRLVHVGSIASLYLGPQPRPVTGEVPPDPEFERRNDYARAKAMCDRMLLDMHARLGLPVVILRPGLVVGEGGIALHGGLGFFNNEQHCLGWNGGRNPLPFVLVEDVADAVLLACRAEGVDGRCYNIVGDVRPSAREYIAALATATRRPLKFHPQIPAGLFAADLGKWVIKRAGGRRSVVPSRRDFVSRGLIATFDCGDAKRDLGWVPVSDPAAFHARAIGVHAR
ncbi:MAG: NAD-dependent epimerase/dehydratase family protein, partial [Acetobacteraceae bacterium]